MDINIINSCNDKIKSSLNNSVNIHDTPSSMKHKYLCALKGTGIEDSKKSVDVKETNSNNISLHINAANNHDTPSSIKYKYLCALRKKRMEANTK